LEVVNFFEASAKARINVDECFHGLVRLLQNPSKEEEKDEKNKKEEDSDKKTKKKKCLIL